VNFLKNTYKTCLLISALYFFSLGGCTSKSTKIQKTNNTILNQLLKSAPIITINIDHFQIDTVIATKKNVMGLNSNSNISLDDPLGTSRGIVKIGDSLYIGDLQRNCIWVMDDHGIWFRKIGNKGKAPGEFGELLNIIHNSHNIFTLDMSNARIQIYNLHLKLLTSFIYRVVGNVLMGKNVAVTDSLLYLPRGPEFKNLIEKRRATPPYDSLGTFWPRLIPLGDQPGGFNDLYDDTNIHGLLAIAYAGLPYIFILNKNQKIKNIIYIKSSHYENPSPKPIHKDAHTMSDAVEVHDFIHNLFIRNNGSLYFFIGKNFYIISYNPTKRTYKLNKVIHFTYGNSNFSKIVKHDIASASSMNISRDTLYFGTLFNKYIFRFPLH
jgi:hypothetical protein